MDTAPTITYRSPRDLRPHPLNRAMPRIQPGMAEWGALFDDVRTHGILQPIQIIDGHLVVDGETRRQIALAIPLETVPVIEVPQDEGVTVLVRHLCLQKHLTKGQRAYLSYHLAKGLEGESKARRMAGLKKGHSPMPTESASGNIGDFARFCEHYGFSRDLFEQARTLHGIFSGDPFVLKARNLEGQDPEALKATWEPRILDLSDPVGLGAALAGMAGAKATEGTAKVPNPEMQLDLFTDGVAALDKVAKNWTRIRRDRRPDIVAAWTKVAAGWPPDLRRELAASLLAGLVDGAESLSETARDESAPDGSEQAA